MVVEAEILIEQLRLRRVQLIAARRRKARLRKKKIRDRNRHRQSKQ